MHPFLLRVRNKLDPEYLWRRFSHLCRDAGLNSSQLIVSFDCDTPEDAEVVEDVHARLQEIGVTASYAVPGELIEGHRKVYRAIAATSAEFLNHGGRSHTFFNEQRGRYESNFFYHEQSWEDLQTDIERGHRVLTTELGVVPVGWRTPHFGTFQKSEHFGFLYQQLARMSYRYSSSRLPTYGFSHGPFTRDRRSSILEFPVTGAPEYPFNILDSWAYFEAPDRIRQPDDYLRQCEHLAKLARGYPMLINIYADPSHVARHEEFFSGIEALVRTAKPTSFQSLIEGLQ